MDESDIVGERVLVPARVDHGTVGGHLYPVIRVENSGHRFRPRSMPYDKDEDTQQGKANSHHTKGHFMPFTVSL